MHLGLQEDTYFLSSLSSPFPGEGLYSKGQIDGQSPEGYRNLQHNSAPCFEHPLLCGGGRGFLGLLVSQREVTWVLEMVPFP